MSTDPNRGRVGALVEALGDFIASERDRYQRVPDDMDSWMLAERLLDSPAMRDLLAEAWDEGFGRGFYDPLAGHGASGRDASESLARNPYDRQETA